ncbi:hypothetical protein PAE9249_04762 [Paenibacillus sp. CECT 9249]|uniref:hypothetical protein n=1 Tax=Paenibacillus sp. CECT 9249 TaxID=2845385 RepID=UPI001E2ECB97|nr:hypothetical protein [Paenibacillus sp. CECT 9249]CAH0122215.1 hypothetical protein PAE9249_04762 [Paenibacillus sp. CECT 9249]
MNIVDPSRLALARSFMKQHARPLERAIYAYEFESDSSAQVLEELVKFQNADGGFGRGLEPDLRCQESSALATTRGLEILGLLPPSDERNAIVRKALDYLAATYRDERRGWDIIPPEAENAPRAVWWNYGAFSDHWGNPNADIVAYFLDYRSLVTYDKLGMLFRYAVDYLQNECDLKEMHEMFCFLRLAERLDEGERAAIEAKMRLFLDNCVPTDPKQREGYGAEPLQVADSPKSRYYGKYADIIPGELDALIAGQGEDGAWAPNWTWYQYEEEWRNAKEEWKGIITLQSLRTLRNYNRLGSTAAEEQ